MARPNNHREIMRQLTANRYPEAEQRLSSRQWEEIASRAGGLAVRSGLIQHRLAVMEEVLLSDTNPVQEINLGVSQDDEPYSAYFMNNLGYLLTFELWRAGVPRGETVASQRFSDKFEDPYQRAGLWLNNGNAVWYHGSMQHPDVQQDLIASTDVQIQNQEHALHIVLPALLDPDYNPDFAEDVHDRLRFRHLLPGNR